MKLIGVVLCGTAFTTGMIGVVSGLGASSAGNEGGRTTGVAAGDGTRATGRRGGPEPSGDLLRYFPRIGLATIAGAAAGLATGWIVAVPIGVVAGLGLPALFGRTAGSVTMAKIEAVATWTEMLQSTLAASAGLSQAIAATAPLSPMPIREETSRLAALLEAGAPPKEALLRFADEVGDPSSDRVVCALLLSFQSRGQRLGELLAALAESTREEVALRLRIETSRASVRSSVRTVLVFSVAFAVGLVVLAHSYLSPFGTPTGQLVLLIVALLYAAGLWMMVALARPPAPIRLLGRNVVRR